MIVNGVHVRNAMLFTSVIGTIVSPFVIAAHGLSGNPVLPAIGSSIALVAGITASAGVVDYLNDKVQASRVEQLKEKALAKNMNFDDVTVTVDKEFADEQGFNTFKPTSMSLSQLIKEKEALSSPPYKEDDKEIVLTSKQVKQAMAAMDSLGSENNAQFKAEKPNDSKLGAWLDSKRAKQSSIKPI